MIFIGDSGKNPVLYIQPDWHSALSLDDGRAWISCKYKDEPGIYGMIERERNEDDGVSSLKISDDFIIEQSGGSFICIKHKNSSLTTYFLKPTKCWSNLHEKSVGSLSVTPSGLAVSTSLDDSLILWNADQSIVKLRLTGHVGEVNRCRFFPSGQVVLTAGSDVRLKIWCAKTGQCPVTLVGHTRPVTDVAFVDRGKNILSCGRDGVLKLWNCGDASCIYNIIKLPSAINACKLAPASSKLNLGEPKHKISDKEVNTENKIVLLGCEDGTVHCVALKSHKKLFTINVNSAVNCLCFINNEYFIFGCQDGTIFLYSIFGPSKEIYSWKQSNSTVLSLLDYKNIGFFASRADGTVEFCFTPGNSLVKISLTGSDCDPVYDLATDGEDIYTCCRDSKIRRYRVKELIKDLSKLHLFSG
ncbi:hypothetical protein O3M35_000209 [Rhynocoris fuscipes]|uniref:Proteasomal ATPase-associated factor 1 n=1 Tax=Rhynocoris fuscipes TaxID=488301 RepID=A0AAW1DKQ7_9HEMI